MRDEFIIVQTSSGAARTAMILGTYIPVDKNVSEVVLQVPILISTALEPEDLIHPHSLWWVLSEDL